MRRVSFVANAEAECPSPTAEVTVDRIRLFFEGAVAGFKLMVETRAPILIKPIVKATIVNIISCSPVGQLVSQIEMAERETPDVVWNEADTMVCQAKVALVDTVAQV